MPLYSPKKPFLEAFPTPSAHAILPIHWELERFSPLDWKSGAGVTYTQLSLSLPASYAVPLSM